MTATPAPRLCRLGRLIDRFRPARRCPVCGNLTPWAEMVNAPRGGLDALTRYHQSWGLPVDSLERPQCWDCYSRAWEGLEALRVRRARAVVRENLAAHTDTMAVWDVETAALGSGIIEVSVVTAAGRTFTRLVNPGMPVDPGARTVHGIPDHLLHEAPPWSAVAINLRLWLREQGITTLAAWGDYEVRLLTWEQERAREKADLSLRVAHIDLMALYDGLVKRPPLVARTAHKRYPRHRRLVDAAEHFRVELDPAEHHRAEYDAKATWVVLMGMRGQATAPVDVVFPRGLED